MTGVWQGLAGMDIADGGVYGMFVPEGCWYL